MTISLTHTPVRVMIDLPSCAAPQGLLLMQTGSINHGLVTQSSGVYGVSYGCLATAIWFTSTELVHVIAEGHMRGPPREMLCSPGDHAHSAVPLHCKEFVLKHKHVICLSSADGEASSSHAQLCVVHSIQTLPGCRARSQGITGHVKKCCRSWPAVTCRSIAQVRMGCAILLWLQVYVHPALCH